MTYEGIVMKGDEQAHRYVLAKQGAKPLVVIGVNPSTANEQKPDRTIGKVMGFARLNGFDSFVMLNLYPQRSTAFAGVHRERCDALHARNLEEIRGYLAAYDGLVVLAAWGNLIDERAYLRDCLWDVASVLGEGGREVCWRQIGTLTSGGHPRHPLRPAYAEGLQPFDLEAYLQKTSRR